MDLRISPLVPELVIAAYGAQTGAIPGFGSIPSGSSSSSEFGAGLGMGGIGDVPIGVGDAPGLVCVWSMGLNSRPEYKFAASSPVRY
jgi:hypothetical protein